MYLPKIPAEKKAPAGLSTGRRQVLIAGLAVALVPSTALLAQGADPVLRITGQGNMTTLDEAGINALPWHEITTSTRWTEGVQTFRGPLLRDVLMAGGLAREDLAGRSLVMTALNDFRVTVAADDAWAYDPILAREMNGTLMRVRDKGPLWLIYPRDQNPELQNAVMDERWIWQLSGIEIR